ncbi:hypothetical protein JCM19241_5592 [Vibrio ishigakensis]|uniref:Uncharacterized protein n=1 Tax=Vibrio ishigakensis TaxID=1481914 RepID=A0A0B8Q761_9VIBR|nr:hypothetical protein JCM19241_5592 [Vibrio ishigakensis]
MRKRRKLVDGDLVQFNEEFYLVILNPDAQPAEFELPEIEEVAPQPKKENKPKKEAKQKEQPRDAKSGRKSIDFF